MRLWSIHPRFLDPAGLTACWREGLLAQKVLADRTTGYRHHPQLIRFRQIPATEGGAPAGIVAYLTAIAQEADARGYSYDHARIGMWWAGDVVRPPTALHLTVTDGQLNSEWDHLGAKLANRNPEFHRRWLDARPAPHPLFDVVPGPIADWEKN